MTLFARARWQVHWQALPATASGRRSGTKGAQVTSTRKIALVAGVLFLITFATSIPALWAYQPVLDNPAGYIAGGGSDNRIFFGALLEMFLIIANVGTAVVLFPILRRRSETLSLRLCHGAHH